MMQRLTFGLAAALSLAACVSPAVADQPTIRLFPKGAPGALPGMPPLVVETRPGTPGRTIRNVSDPTIEAYLPDPKIATGTGVVIAPGGGFHMLSYDNEGVEVAKWLNSIGIAAFVLRYRLLPTGDDVGGVLIPIRSAFRLWGLARRNKYFNINMLQDAKKIWPELCQLLHVNSREEKSPSTLWDILLSAQELSSDPVLTLSLEPKRPYQSSRAQQLPIRQKRKINIHSH